MKKLSSIISVGLVLALLAGCGKTAANPTNTPETPANTAAPATETPTNTATPKPETPANTANPATETPANTTKPETPANTANPETPANTATPSTETPANTTSPEPTQKPGNSVDADGLKIGKLSRTYKVYKYLGQTVNRWFYYYVPTTYKEGDKLPLMITLHGSGSNAAAQIAEGDWVNHAEKEGYILVAPEAVGISKDRVLSSEGKSLIALGWRYTDISYLRWAAASTDPQTGYRVDDVKYLSDLIDAFVDTGVVDASRVYVNGFSHGGFMALRLAVEAPEKLAGVAAVSGLLIAEHSSKVPSQKVRVVFIQGSADMVVPIDGMRYDLNNDGEKEYTWALSLDESTEWFLEKYGVENKPSVTQLPDVSPNDGTTITRYEYDNADGTPQVIKYVVNGGGHTWPGGIYANGHVSRDAQASELIWAELKDAVNQGID